jgi:hypothetical protein
MLLIQRGVFGLRTPVAELVPEFGRNAASCANRASSASTSALRCR